MDETATLAAQYRSDGPRNLTPEGVVLDAAGGVGDVVQGVRQHQVGNPPDRGATVSALFPAPELNVEPVTVTLPSVTLLYESGEPQRNVKPVTGAAKLIVPEVKKPAAVLSTE